ncbi:MAG: hypothetical protein KKD77_21020, partial [Gammaproteobacteria bacterium]|nr:hypothetical protein [Gammaproteobacteria bacterium]
MLTRRAVILAKIEQVESTLQSGSTDTLIVLNAGASSVNNYYRGWDMKISGETRTIISYNGSSKTAT